MIRKIVTDRDWAPVIAIVAAGYVCGCSIGAGNFLSSAPVASEEFTGNYQQLANCVYAKITTDIRNSFKKYDSPSTKTVRIAADGNGVRYWELILTETEPGKASASLIPVITNWGPDTVSSSDIIPTVRACASS